MSRDGEPQDPWLANSNARRAAMDKKLDDSHARLKASIAASIGDLHATLNERIEDSRASLNERIEDLSVMMKKFRSSFDNSA
jgi:hypothetical protein